MADERLMRKLLALQVRGNYGYPWGCGEYRCGFNLLGEENELAGTYQRRHGRFGPYFARTRFNREYTSASPAQLACRENFRTGKLLWDALSPEDKKKWHKRKWPINRTGYNRFMRNYLMGRSLDI